jgi:hypothetical protein
MKPEHPGGFALKNFGQKRVKGNANIRVEPLTFMKMG